MLEKNSKMSKKENPSGGEGAATAIAGVDEKKASRRKFVKSAAVGAVALTGTAELAKHVVSSISDQTPQLRYEKDIQAGDAAMSEWEYVVMSDREKRDMVQAFIDNYKNKV